jgi:hypothetical protein
MGGDWIVIPNECEGSRFLPPVEMTEQSTKTLFSVLRHSLRQGRRKRGDLSTPFIWLRLCRARAVRLTITLCSLLFALCSLLRARRTDTGFRVKGDRPVAPTCSVLPAACFMPFALRALLFAFPLIPAPSALRPAPCSSRVSGSAFFAAGSRSRRGNLCSLTAKRSERRQPHLPDESSCFGLFGGLAESAAYPQNRVESQRL